MVVQIVVHSEGVISGVRILCHIVGVPGPSVGHVPLRHCCARGWRSRDCGYVLGGSTERGTRD